MTSSEKERWKRGGATTLALAGVFLFFGCEGRKEETRERDEPRAQFESIEREELEGWSADELWSLGVRQYGWEPGGLPEGADVEELVDWILEDEWLRTLDDGSGYADTER